LWRRAPLWRLAAGATLTFGVLSALYPAAWVARGLSAALPVAPARIDRTPVVIGPPLTPSRRGTFRLAGRVLPLPPGDWHEVLAGRFEPGPEVNEIVLVRLSKAALTGLIDATGTTGPAVGVAGLPTACVDPTDLASHTDSGGTECWFVGRAPPPAPVPEGRSRSMLDGALDRLRGQGVVIPAMMVRGGWARDGGGEKVRVTFDMADMSADRVEALLKGMLPRFDAGFSGPR
jgi:hypothetical protein